MVLPLSHYGGFFLSKIQGGGESQLLKVKLAPLDLFRKSDKTRVCLQIVLYN